MDWEKRLPRTVATREGNSVSTLAQAARLALDNTKTGKTNAWQSTAQKLMSAAESGKQVDIEEATKQLELALLLDGRLKFTSPVR